MYVTPAAFCLLSLSLSCSLHLQTFSCLFLPSLNSLCLGVASSPCGASDRTFPSIPSFCLAIHPALKASNQQSKRDKRILRRVAAPRTGPFQLISSVYISRWTLLLSQR